VQIKSRKSESWRSNRRKEQEAQEGKTESRRNNSRQGRGAERKSIREHWHTENDADGERIMKSCQ
jgi:hypothetical protein